jgi:hypothetical protein
VSSLLLLGCSLPMRVSTHEGPDGIQDGYIVDIVRDGRTISQIGVLFDNEVSRLMQGLVCIGS